MKIDHVHFYVEDAKASRDWFVRHLGFQSVMNGANHHTRTEVIRSGPVYFVLSSALTSASPVAQFLAHHPAGVADIAFLVQDVEAAIARALKYGANVLQPIQQYQQGQVYCRWAKIAAWGSLTHTLLERSEDFSFFPTLIPSSLFPCSFVPTPLSFVPAFTSIDHVVLNVGAGDLERAVTWYKNILEFHCKQTFKIQTDQSALHSQVMVSADGSVQLPINQPASPNSQIQEFLDINRGPGIQHIALQTANIVQVVAQFRVWGLSFLPVPPSYYTQLLQRQPLPIAPTEFQEIAAQQILVDWEEKTTVGIQDDVPLLLQTFTQPIFAEPTLFFELIERRAQACGFGEGNFRALFEAVEREQRKRGNLP